MDKMVVKGGIQLNGVTAASGAKNSVLPLIFSTLLGDGEHIFHNVPDLVDVKSACSLLEHLGCEISYRDHTLRIIVKGVKAYEAPYDIVRKMRASILVLGPLLARFKEAKVSLPGGCAIGTRPIDLHLEGMKALGGEIEVESGYVLSKTSGLRGAKILFESPTVGGTENIMMAATLADGE